MEKPVVFYFDAAEEQTFTQIADLREGFYVVNADFFVGTFDSRELAVEYLTQFDGSFDEVIIEVSRWDH